MKKQPQHPPDADQTSHDLVVFTLPEFTNIKIKGDYSVSFLKIGDSILYIQLKGNLKHFNYEKEIHYSSDFQATSHLKKPYISIIDLSEATDHIPFTRIKKMMRYFNDHQHAIQGLVLINNPSWLNAFITQGLRYYNPDFVVLFANNYPDAVRKAQQIIDNRDNVKTLTQAKSKSIGYQEILFKKEWEYHNKQTGFVYRIGCIPNRLLYTSMHGAITESHDITHSFLLAEKVIHENDLKNIPWVITDFSKLAEVRSIRLRQQFLKEAKRVLKESGNAKAYRIFINPGRFNKIIIRIFAPYIISDYFIADSIEQAIDKINEVSGAGKASSDVNNIYVSAAHLEEVSNAFVSLLSFDDLADEQLKISQNNPLAYLIESLELVKNDINELRNNELKIQQERLNESEAARIALQQEEESRRILLDNIPTQVWYLIDAKTYGTVNKAHAGFMGADAADLEYKSLFEIFPPQVAEEYIKLNQQIFDTGKVIKSELWVSNSKKELRFLSVTKTPKLRPEGTVEYVVCSAEDITERWLSEQALRDTKNQLRQVIDLVPHLIYARDADGRYIMANAAIARAYGTSPDDMLGKTDYDFNPRLEQVQQFLEDDRKVLESGTKLRILEKVTNLEGKKIFLETTKIPFTFSDHGKTSLLGISVDITDRVMAEEALRNSETRLRTFLANQPGIAFIIDKNGIYMLSEGKGLAKIGLKPGQVVGMSFFDVFKEYPETHLSVRKALEGEEQFLTVKIGEVVFESWLGPLLDDNGNVTGMIGISSDITARIQSAEIRQQLEVARKTTQFKQNFLAKMSHEIRTPLTGVLGMIDILEQTPLSMHQKDYLNTMKTSGENLRFIINQVLEYSKIEAGKVIINPVVFEYRTLPETTLNLYKDNLHAGVKFLIDTDADIHPFIKADQARLLQVLNNLVSNAVKFTQEGSVTIRSSLLTSHSPATQILKVEVMDTGRGMPAELQVKLFSPFVQGEESSEGTGLGLSICKELVAMMGGNIGVESEEGKGSNFWFTFPAEKAREMASRQNTLPVYDSERKLKILVTEDSRVIQKFTHLLLTSLGHSVSIAVNGKQALDMFEPGRFDLILMDVQMPVMDGVTATQKLKEKYTHLPPIVGLSANAFEGDPEKYISLGMDDYLTKPFNKEDFQSMLARVMSK